MTVERTDTEPEKDEPVYGQMSRVESPVSSKWSRFTESGLQRSGGKGAGLIAIALAVAIAMWAVGILLNENLLFAMLAPQAQAGVAAASAFARLFAALILGLYAPPGRSGDRLRWVAAGLLVLGLGSLGFGYLKALLGLGGDLNVAAYEALAVRVVAGALFVVGLFPRRPPKLTREMIVGAILLLTVLGFLGSSATHLLPTKISVVDPEEAVELAISSGGLLPGLTSWHLLLSALPLLMASAAAAGATWGYRRGEVQGWLLIATVLLAGSQLHSLFWPTAYSAVVTTSDLLRLAFAAVIVVGGVMELSRVARERASLLAEEKERTRRLSELAALKADFTSMVAHEFGSPLSAVCRLTDVLDFGETDAEMRNYALGAIRNEIATLKTLVADVQAAAIVEREDFVVQPKIVAPVDLLADARTHAETLPGGHPINVCVAGLSGKDNKVNADAKRIGQVLRNLLDNAVKYSAEGTPILLRAHSDGRSVTLEVADKGFGIFPEDESRIFEKFGRGTGQNGEKVPGVGLGLYLSRRILQGHGSDLKLRTTPGEGSTFSFALEAVGGKPR